MEQTGLEITFGVLGRSSNRAASRLAMLALRSAYFAIRRAAVEATLKRTEPEGHLALLERWTALGPALRSAAPKRRAEFVRTLEERLPQLHGDLRTAAIEAATFLGACELLPSMIRAATRGSALDRSSAERAAVDLAGILTRERLSTKPRLSQLALLDIHTKSVAAVKERIREAVDRPESPLFEILFVLVEDVEWLSSTLLRSKSELKGALIAAIRRTRNPAALDRALDLFANAAASVPIAQALEERRDPEFLEATLRALEGPSSGKLVERLRATRLLDWLEPNEATLRLVPRRYGPLLLRLAMRLTDHPPRMREILEGFYRAGEADVRREALRLARRLPSHLTEELLHDARFDEDPHTLADLLPLLREKGSPEMYEAATDALRRGDEAALAGLRRAFPELTYETLVRRADSLDRNDLQALAKAIFELRPEAIDRLREGVSSPNRELRIRSLRMASSVGTPVEAIESALLAAVQEPDRFVREAALEALAKCDTDDSADALTAALSDELPQIRDLAERLLTDRVLRRTTMSFPRPLRPKQLAAFVASASHGYATDSDHVEERAR